MFILFFLSFLAHAQIVCTHPQACNIARDLIQGETVLKSVVATNIDPHLFDPSISQIKELSTAPILLAGPKELQPWLSTILKAREKKKLPTFQFSIVKSNKNITALSHFWIYPESVCFNWMTLRQFLAAQKYAVKADDCPNPVKPAKSIDKIIVLSHDALEPLLSKYSSQIIALKTSDHHAEILPSTLKKLSALPNSDKVLWIMEKNILIPDQIMKRYKQSSHTVLNFDLDGTMGEKTHDRFLDLMKKIGL